METLMETLTNKIFDAITKCRDEQFNEFTKKQLDHLLEEVVQIVEEAEFEEFESMKDQGKKLLNQFFNHKSDANKYLMADEQEDLEKEFGEWYFKTCRYYDKYWISIKDELPERGQFVECKWNPEGENYKTPTTKEILRGDDNMQLYGVTHWRRI